MLTIDRYSYKKLSTFERKEGQEAVGRIIRKLLIKTQYFTSVFFRHLRGRKWTMNH